MNTKILFTLLVSFIGICHLHAQQKKAKKSDLYVYFDAKMRGENEVSTYRSDRKEYSLFIFEVWEPRQRTIFCTIDKNKFQLVDSSYLKTIDMKSSDFLIDYCNFNEDPQTMRSRNYNHVFLVDQISDNQFKIIEIKTFMGDIFFAPQGRKNPDG